MHIPGEEREKGTESLFKEIIDENFLSLWKELDFRTEANRIPNYINTKRPFPRHILFKLSKINDKERILKIARGKKTVTYKENPVILSSDLSSRNITNQERMKENIQNIEREEPSA